MSDSSTRASSSSMHAMDGKYFGNICDGKKTHSSSTKSKFSLRRQVNASLVVAKSSMFLQTPTKQANTSDLYVNCTNKELFSRFCFSAWVRSFPTYKKIDIIIIKRDHNSAKLELYHKSRSIWSK